MGTMSRQGVAVAVSKSKQEEIDDARMKIVAAVTA